MPPQTMSPETSQRPQWDIDRILERLTGRNVRALARAFAPITPANGNTFHMIAARSLYLPDNSQPELPPGLFRG